MGGLGSGKWQRFDSKTLIKNCLYIDICQLSREGSVKPWQWSFFKWQNGFNIAIRTKPEALELFYTITYGGQQPEEVHLKVPLSWTSCTYGGKRSWFICPGEGCGRQVTKLYLKDRYFRCRHCHNLAYSSQREGKESRLMHKAQSIYQQLGANRCDDLYVKPKPKGMHQATYDTLSKKALELDFESLVIMQKKFRNFVI